MIQSMDELTERLFRQLGQSQDLLEGDYDDPDSQWYEAGEIALKEMGLALPIANQSREYWLLSRSKRHAFDMIRTSSARKFKYKQINLNQRFDHFDRLIQELDAAYLTALETDPDLMGIQGDLFIGFVKPGFVYSTDGVDLTYKV